MTTKSKCSKLKSLSEYMGSEYMGTSWFTWRTRYFQLYHAEFEEHHH